MTDTLLTYSLDRARTSAKRAEPWGSLSSTASAPGRRGTRGGACRSAAFPAIIAVIYGRRATDCPLWCEEPAQDLNDSLGRSLDSVTLTQTAQHISGLHTTAEAKLGPDHVPRRHRFWRRWSCDKGRARAFACDTRGKWNACFPIDDGAQREKKEGKNLQVAFFL